MSARAPEAAREIEEVSAEARRRFPDLAPEVRRRLEASLRDDMVTEYDARFLVEYLEALPLPFSSEFRLCLERWYEDEVRHFRSFRRLVESCVGEVEQGLKGRRPDFRGVAHLFGGEFEILCLLAYDELATLRGYKGNLPMYALLGDGLATMVRRVIADEAGHYASFRSLLVDRHAGRLGEVPAVVRRIRASEGTPYRATFVLDHDDPVYGDHIFDEAARVLVRQMRCEEHRLRGAGVWNRVESRGAFV